MNAIHIENLEKIYPRSWLTKPVKALKGVSFSVPQGQVFGFIGANGAGKSTTIKILTGAMRASRGMVSLFGVRSDDPKARTGMGYVPENPSLPDYLTPLEVLRMAMSLHGLKVGDPDSHCMAWLARFQIDHVAKKSIRSFSKGMAQRTALAHALCVNPRLLVLDEPLSGLDPVGRRDVVDILAEYKRQGGTVFLTSHVLHDVERLADRFALIHQGEIKTVKSPVDMARENQLYLVRSVGDVPVGAMLPEGDGRWSAEVAGESLWAVLAQLQGARHQIIEVRPKLGLEQLFMHYVNGGTASV